MPRDDAAEDVPLRTHRGAVMRERIVRAAARIVFSRGVAGTSIEQVLTASNASRSQLHRYFANKEAVIEQPQLPGADARDWSPTSDIEHRRLLGDPAPGSV